MIPVRSSAIRAVDYDITTKRLLIKFTSGYSYVYHGVPESVFNGLLNASSKGQYFNRYIKNHYR